MKRRRIWWLSLAILLVITTALCIEFARLVQEPMPVTLNFVRAERIPQSYRDRIGKPGEWASAEFEFVNSTGKTIFVDGNTKAALLDESALVCKIKTFDETGRRKTQRHRFDGSSAQQDIVIRSGESVVVTGIFDFDVGNNEWFSGSISYSDVRSNVRDFLRDIPVVNKFLGRRSLRYSVSSGKFFSRRATIRRLSSALSPMQRFPECKWILTA